MNTVLITGASSGIGAQLYRHYLSDGWRVVCVQRTNPLNAEHFVACDLSDQAQVAAAAEKIVREYPDLDVMIMNAGFGLSGATELLDEQAVRTTLEVDYFAAFFLSRALLCTLKPHGKIVFISSACALFALPFRTVYCSAKAALNMLAFGLRMELDGAYDVVCVCPGDIRTRFTQNRLKSFDTNERYGDRVRLAAQTVDGREHKRMDEKTCGKKIYRICRRGRRALYVVGAKYKALRFFANILPVNLWLRLTGRMFGGRGQNKKLDKNR